MIKFNLIENAKDSLIHAVDHITSPEGVTSGDYKRVILDIYHAMELLLKEKVRSIHPAFIWEKVDNYPSLKENTISAMKALDRLSRFSEIRINEEHRRTIDECRLIRNRIEHYEFEISEKEAKGIIGRMLSLVFWFSKNQLDIDFEHELRNDDRWESLAEIYEFWEAHKNNIEDELFRDKTPVWQCPYCGANTFVISSETCRLCGHSQPIVECEVCNQEEFWTETEMVAVDGSPEKMIVCHGCLEKIESTREKGKITKGNSKNG